MSDHKWHAAAALTAAKHFGQIFKSWNILSNNCWHWSTGLVKFMKDRAIRGLVQCEQVEDWEDLLDVANTLGFDIRLISPKSQIDKNHVYAV